MKKMKLKQWLGPALIGLGVIALIISYTIKGRVGEEMGNVRTIISPLSNAGQGGKMAGGMVESRASGEAAGYLETAQFLTIAGVVLIIAGGVVIFLRLKKKK